MCRLGLDPVLPPLFLSLFRVEGEDAHISGSCRGIAEAGPTDDDLEAIEKPTLLIGRDPAAHGTVSRSSEGTSRSRPSRKWEEDRVSFILGIDILPDDCERDLSTVDVYDPPRCWLSFFPEMATALLEIGERLLSIEPERERFFLVTMEKALFKDLREPPAGLFFSSFSSFCPTSMRDP